MQIRDHTRDSRLEDHGGIASVDAVTFSKCNVRSVFREERSKLHGCDTKA